MPRPRATRGGGEFLAEMLDDPRPEDGQPGDRRFAAVVRPPRRLEQLADVRPGGTLDRASRPIRRAGLRFWNAQRDAMLMM